MSLRSPGHRAVWSVHDVTMRRRQFPRLADLRPPRRTRPLTTAAPREYHAVRLSLLLLAGVVQASLFTPAHAPIPGSIYEQLAWLRRTLRSLARGAPSVALLIRLIDLDGPRMRWDDPAVLRRHLERLARDAAALGQGMISPRHHRRSSATDNTLTRLSRNSRRAH